MRVSMLMIALIGLDFCCGLPNMMPGSGVPCSRLEGSTVGSEKNRHVYNNNFHDVLRIRGGGEKNPPLWGMLHQKVGNTGSTIRPWGFVKLSRKYGEDGTRREAAAYLDTSSYAATKKLPDRPNFTGFKMGASGPTTLHQQTQKKQAYVARVGHSKVSLFFLQAAKCFVGLSGTLWCWGCLTGLLAVLRAFNMPGGLEFMEQQSSHGLPGVALFVLFTSLQLAVQLAKIWTVVVGTKLSEVKQSFMWLAGFNIFFVYMCWWRVSPSLDNMTTRDLMMLFEAACMVVVVFMTWLRQPWRARGRTLAG
jgi:hypothetical protein